MSMTSTRPLARPFSRGGSGPRALLRLLQVHVSTSTTTDLSNIPTAGCAFGTTANFDNGFPGSEGNRQKGSRSGAGEHRSSALPAAIARPGDFAPTLARFGRLLSRISAFRPVRRDAGRGGDRHRLARSVRRPAARLQGDATGRAVRHRTSAKRPDVHQPEAPSIPRPFENERRSLLSAELSARCTSAFFTGRKRSRGTPASTRTARPTDADEP
jgi:hypothetical protein